MKNILKKILQKFNYKFINLKNRKKHQTFEIIKYLLEKIPSDNYTIFDVGGNIGEFSKKVENEIYTISNKKICEFFIFEPNKELLKQIDNQKIKNAKVFNFGIGDKVTKTKFKIHEKHDKSSFLDIDELYFDNRKKYKITEVDCHIDTLDNFTDKNNINFIDFLKIDAQGFNEEVIAGSKNLIENNKIGIIYSEIILGKKYSKCEAFYNFEKFLHKNYALYGIDVGNYMVEVVSKRFAKELNLDVFYVNKKYL